MCVCVRERERERESVCVCVCKRDVLKAIIVECVTDGAEYSRMSLPESIRSELWSISYRR